MSDLPGRASRSAFRSLALSLVSSRSVGPRARARIRVSSDITSASKDVWLSVIPGSSPSFLESRRRESLVMKRSRPARSGRKRGFTTLDEAQAAQEHASDVDSWNSILAFLRDKSCLKDFKEAWEKMILRVTPNEASYFLLMSVGASDPGHVRNCFYAMLKARVTPHVRDYALFLKAEADDAEADVKTAWNMFQDMKVSGLKPTPSILASLVKVSRAAPGGSAYMNLILDECVRWVPVLEDECLQSAFQQVGDNTGWKFDMFAGPSELGVLDKIGGLKLKRVDVRPADLDTLLAQVEKLAVTSGRKQADDFETFKRWFKLRGPYDVVIDAANVAYCDKRRSDWRRVESAVRQLESSERSVLVIVHEKWLMAERGARDSIQRMQRESKAYVVPRKSNDDWYWLHATMAGSEAAWAITNDLCHDHAFASMQAGMLTAWHGAHTIRFKINPSNPSEVILDRPSSFTPRAQIIGKGIWGFPMAPGPEGAWVVISKSEEPGTSEKGPE